MKEKRGKSTFAKTEVRSREEKKKKTKEEANSVREEKLGKLGEGGGEVGQTH